MALAELTLKDSANRSRRLNIVWSPSDDATARWAKDWARQAGGRGDSSHWDWDAIRREGARKADNHALVALVENDECHALLLLLWPKEAVKARPKSLVYIDYLEVAPKHRHRRPVDRDLLGVGAAMLDYAVGVSCKVGLEGRIALHSLETAEGFYRKYGLVEGSPDPHPENLLYFELVEDGAPLCR